MKANGIARLPSRMLMNVLYVPRVFIFCDNSLLLTSKSALHFKGTRLGNNSQFQRKRQQKKTLSALRFRHSPLQGGGHHGDGVRLLRPQNQRGQERRRHRAKGQENHAHSYRRLRHDERCPQGIYMRGHINNFPGYRFRLSQWCNDNWQL